MTEEKKKNNNNRNRVAGVIILLGIFVIGGIGGYYYWQYLSTHITTDNAYVKGHIYMVSSKTDGTVKELYIKDNIKVRKGDLLVKIDPEDFEVKVRKAGATLEVAEQEIKRRYAAVETWVLTSYLVSNAIILPITGWLGSLIGRKRFLISCILLFSISSFLCGSAPNLKSLVFFRILQGLGGGALQPLSQAILLETFPLAEHGMAMAAYGIGVVIAPILGPLVGGWITDNFTWRWIFYINIPICALSVIMTMLFIFDPPYIRKARGRIDYFGLGFLAVGLGCLQIVLDKGEREGWFESNFIIYMSIIAALGLILFVITELFFVKKPVVNLRVLKDLSFTSGNIMMFLGFFVMFSSIVLYPIFLQTLMGYTATLAGMVLGPGGLTILIFMPITGILLKSIDARKILFVGFVIGSYAVYMMSNLNLEAGFINVIWPRVVQGVGVAFFFVPLMTATMRTIPKEEMGNATGIFNLVRNLGGSFGTAFVMTTLSRRAQYHQSMLVEKLTPYDPAFLSAFEKSRTLLMHSFEAVNYQFQSGLQLVYNMMLRESMMLSFCDLFFMLCMLNLLLLPLTFLLSKTTL